EEGGRGGRAQEGRDGRAGGSGASRVHPGGPVKLVGRVPVEQLDAERLVNIERRIVANARIGAEPRPSRRLLAFATVAMAAVVTGIVGWQLHRPEAGPAIV